MNIWILITASILLVLSLLLVVLSTMRRSPFRSAARQRINSVIGASADARPWRLRLFAAGLVKHIDAASLAQRKQGSTPAELDVLLRRAGWYRRDARAVFRIVSALFPVAVLISGSLCGASADMAGSRFAGLLFIAVASAYLAPRYMLRYLVAQRQRRIAREVPVLLRLLNVLFEASLSLEHALSVLRDQAGELLPGLAPEIDLFLQRVNAGADRVAALEQMAATLDVPELNDTVAVLSQAAQLGGGIKQSLTRLAQTIEEREQTTLRETIGRLSAKMTIVMVVFLFPALFIFLAGPGLLAVGHALGAVGG